MYMLLGLLVLIIPSREEDSELAQAFEWNYFIVIRSVWRMGVGGVLNNSSRLSCHGPLPILYAFLQRSLRGEDSEEEVRL